ncbi:MAG TPA: hypothetical protein PLA44_15105 [Propionibacteriaceae bacterium]|nr:hypothetical protein [Propionibacteriaceae bacterium]
MTKQRPVSGRAGTPAALADTKAAGLARQQELDAVRASAGKWQGGLAGLLVLVTSATGFGLRDDLSALDSGYAVAVGALLSLSIGGALVALLLALHASGGVPRLIKAKSAPPDLAHRDATTAAARLRAAIVLAIGSLVVFTVANWVHGAAPKPRVDSATVTSSTTTACGTTEIAGDYVLVTSKDGRVVPLPLSSVQTWVTTTSCP